MVLLTAVGQKIKHYFVAPGFSVIMERRVPEEEAEDEVEGDPEGGEDHGGQEATK